MGEAFFVLSIRAKAPAGSPDVASVPVCSHHMAQHLVHATLAKWTPGIYEWLQKTGITGKMFALNRYLL